MDHNKEGLVDLLEIYHAREVLRGVTGQIKRITLSNQHLSVVDLARKREALHYYQAVQVTLTELLYQLGDEAN